MDNTGESNRAKLLWAPWRATYIHEDKKEGCIFCFSDDKPLCSFENLILWSDGLVFVMMNKYPYSPGHLMVCPHRHVKDLEELTEAELPKLLELTKKTLEIMRKTMKPDGFNVGINLGKTAGAGFEEHLHLHIVPRWNGDHNFMPVLAGVKVISEDLRDTYLKLKQEFDQYETESTS